MPKAGIQSWISTNWKSAVVVSNSSHSRIDSAKTISEVHSAVMRALRATTSGVPRTKAMNTAPATGRNVTRDRIGQFAVMASPVQHIPGDQQDDADQHGKRVVIDVAGLERRCPAGELQGVRGDRIGPQAVDHRLVPLLPEAAAQAERPAHQHPAIKPSQIPLF